MNIPEHFIRRPVMTTLVTSAITLFGWMAYERLPVSDLPNVDFPTISVSASLPGASPETMAASVATPLEQQFSSIAGIESMTSTSSLGSTSVTMQFTLDRSIDGAAQDVQSAIAAVQRRLPQDMPSPPSLRKSNPNDDSILLLALSSKTLALSEVNEYAETVLAQRISTVDGVAQVNVFGSQKYAVRVRLDPRALASRGIGIDEVRSALDTNNVNLPAGVIDVGETCDSGNFCDFGGTCANFGAFSACAQWCRVGGGAPACNAGACGGVDVGNENVGICQ
jgi:HAE1 family hydrophobic/amphiphilic exporter-1